MSDLNTVLFQVDQREIDAILIIPVSPELEGLRALVAASYSITLKKKPQMAADFPKFSAFQLAELDRIPREERVKFAKLNAKHAARQKAIEPPQWISTRQW